MINVEPSFTFCTPGSNVFIIHLDPQGKPLIYRAVEEKKHKILEAMLEFGFGCDVNNICQDGKEKIYRYIFFEVNFKFLRN